MQTAAYADTGRTGSTKTPLTIESSKAVDQKVRESCTVRPVMPPKEGKTGIGIDVVVWNPDEKKLYIFRFGDGEDKVLDLA